MEYYHPEHTQNLNEAELKAAQQEQEEVYTGLAACLRNGQPPDSAEAQQLAERWRAHRNRYYFDCTLTLIQGFAAVYAADPRHRQFFDAYEPGLAAYFGAALQEYYEKHLAKQQV